MTPTVSERFCNNCGHRNPDESNFCSSCGAPLDPASDNPTVTFALDPMGGEDEVSVELDDVPAGGMLIVRSGPNAGSKFTVDKDVITAGRHPESDIFLDDITVSRRHAEFVRRDDRYVVRDVESLNGTYLNRERIEEADLSNGDEVQVGKFKLVFMAGIDSGD